MKIYFFIEGAAHADHLSYFTLAFKNALEQKGCECEVFNTETELFDYFQMIKHSPPDCTFATAGKYSLNRDISLSRQTQIPHFSFCVDSYIYYIQLAKNPYQILGLIDEIGCDFFKLLDFQNTLFLPHATERAFFQLPPIDKRYDVLMVGKYLDFESNRKTWTSLFPSALCKLMHEIVEILLSDPNIPFAELIIKQCFDNNIALHEIDLHKLFICIENYLRGKNRYELVRAIKNSSVTIFGGNLGGARTWKDCFGTSSNHKVYDGHISYKEMHHLIRQSKIFLNSSPSFSRGIHERIPNGFALNSLVVTNHNSYVNQLFHDEKDILLYHYGKEEEIDEKIKFYLSHEERRQDIVQIGRENMLKNHTWDHRADVFVHAVPKIIASMKNLPEQV